jgi:hypothetical protein
MYFLNILKPNQRPQWNSWDGRYLGIIGCEINPKPKQDNVIPNALSKKEEFQVGKTPTKIQALRAIFQRENILERKIREAYVQDLLT